MGAAQFQNQGSAKTADEAFRMIRERAQYEHGHGGYTGTIAEKTSFKMVTPKAGEDPIACVERCSEDQTHFSDDKWGPAACVDAGPDPKKPGNHIFIFFGLASS